MDNLLETILKTCFTKLQALKKLGELREQWEKEKYIVTLARGDAAGAGSRRLARNPAVAGEDGRRDTATAGPRAMENKIQKMEALVIFTAIPLSAEQVPILGNFVREKFPQIKFIDLKVDPALAGGAALGWKGEYKDYSLKQRITKKQ